MGRAHDGFLSPTDIAEARPWHAVFWHNSSGEMKSVSGYCYEETLTKALNECLDQDGIDLVVEIENYLFDTKKLDDDTYEKAVSILRRLRYTYVLTAALGGGGGRDAD